MSTLDILVPTLNEPESISYLKRLMGILQPQVDKYHGRVKVHIHDQGRSLPTGSKRNQLIANSDGEYFSQIDVDDVPAPYYVDEMMKGISMGVDVITFVGAMDTNGGNRRGFTIKLGSDYTEIAGHYYRHPNHLCGYKRSVVERFKFPDIWVQEDYLWSLAVKNARVLKTEYHVTRHMYLYDFKSNKPSYGSTRIRR